MAGSHRRTLVRASLIGTLVLGMSGLTAGSAFAAVTSSVTDGVLSITVGGGDAVTVECETKLADTVLVNLADPDTGPADCDSITLLRMVGDATASVIDLAGVTAGDFPNLDETRVNAGGGGDTFFGSPLMDRYVGGPGGPELIRTGGGNDLITGGGDVDDINGGGGFDTLHEHADADFTLTNTSLTGVGEDRLASIERAKLYGGVHPPERRAEARTSLLGELFDNSLDASAFSGPVLLSGGAGDDVLVGGSGEDRLRGSSGNDALTGGPGDDYLRAGNGDDTLDLTDSTQANDYGQGDRGFDTCSTDTGDLVWSCEILTLAAFT